jgi:hypothetical protein
MALLGVDMLNSVQSDLRPCVFNVSHDSVGEFY